jgi:uncharacterized membrane protein (DUF4010 family)
VGGEVAIPEATQILIPTFVAICLGALVGLERQIAQEEREEEKDFPGVRTFAFTALLGALAVLMIEPLGPWIPVALFGAATLLLVVRYRYKTSELQDPGYTTETASLCTFAVGALAQSGMLLVATVVTIAMVALLRLKRFLHQAGELLSPTDMEVFVRFLVITGIVLPLLPDETFDPLGVLSPRGIWWMVVLISGLSFVGYVLMRLGAGYRSYVLTGLLGGLVSSTATAYAYARAARDVPEARRYETVVVIAGSTVFVRLAIILAVVAPALLPGAAPALIVMTLVGLGLCYVRHRSTPIPQERPEYDNPLSMRAAFGFAVIYAVVLLGAAAAGQYFASAGTYVVTALAATVGSDAPTLTLARLANGGQLTVDVAAVGMGLVAIMTTLGKVGVLLLVGRGAFLRRVALTLVAMAASGTAVLVWL